MRRYKTSNPSKMHSVGKAMQLANPFGQQDSLKKKKKKKNSSSRADVRPKTTSGAHMVDRSNSSEPKTGFSLVV